MKYRQSNLLAATSITTAGTKVLDIDAVDPISRLNVIVRATNSSWTPTGHPAKIVVKLELVDGSDVLFSMRGIYAQSMGFYSSRIQPFNYINYTDNGLAVASCPIWFGRYLYDPELALDPKQFKNLQLKIQHDYSLGGAVPDACTLEVWADLFDEYTPTPSGFLTAQSLWSKTLVASTDDYVDLPTDHPIRLVMPAVSSDSEEPDINIDKIKLTENMGKNVIIEAGTLELLQMLEVLWPEWIEYGEGRGLAATNVSFFVTPCKDIMMFAQPSQDLDSYINFTWSGGNKRIIMDSATSTIQVGINGRCPHGAIPIPMGLMDEMDSWWDVTKLKQAQIKMTTGGGDTSALYELLVQQLRSY
jgi:hypothetical protein